MHILPKSKSVRWLWWMLGYGIVLSLLLLVSRYIALGEAVEPVLAFRFVLFAFALAVVVNGFGWLGARLVWAASTLGIAVGVGFMLAYSSRDMSGWEDLAGFLAFMLGGLIGFAVGLLAEGGRWLLLRLRKKR